jgi:hypothetical protein
MAIDDRRDQIGEPVSADIVSDRLIDGRRKIRPDRQSMPKMRAGLA